MIMNKSEMVTRLRSEDYDQSEPFEDLASKKDLTFFTTIS